MKIRLRNDLLCVETGGSRQTAVTQLTFCSINPFNASCSKLLLFEGFWCSGLSARQSAECQKLNN